MHRRIIASRTPFRSSRLVRCMSVRPEPVSHIPNAAPPKMTLQRIYSMRAKGIPITVLTAYDFPTARQCEQNRVDICLVGDSLAQVCLGYDTTTRLTLDEMLHHCKAVSRGAKTPFLVADMPFGTYLTSPPDAVRNAVRLIQEGGVEAVKLEGGIELLPTVKALTSVGIPVMAHIGLLPQRHVSLSGYRIQGKDARSALALFQAARELQTAGAWGIVLEAIPHAVASHITESLKIPTIGIGAGPGCSGQVLVWDDAMGAWAGHQAKFVRRFAHLGTQATAGVKAYIEAVRERNFPDSKKEGYEMADGEWEEFLRLSEGI
ncbi:ketopantoate hydroxymethyltransferase [Ramaria rubella]|nr:ketopantoate hydroxymethyltransferase [Ramaria rubella]